MGWSDPAKMFIVARIRKNTVNQIMKLQNGNEEKRVDATASRLSGKLGKLLMPRIGYEKKKILVDKEAVAAKEDLVVRAEI